LSGPLWLHSCHGFGVSFDWGEVRQTKIGPLCYDRGHLAVHLQKKKAASKRKKSFEEHKQIILDKLIGLLTQSVGGKKSDKRNLNKGHQLLICQYKF